MRITDLEVDGFGIWKDLRLDGFSDHVHVFYGPNEAGKTTLLEFVRSIFYGFSTQRCSRYVPPLSGNTAGGGVRVTGAHGTFLISRHADRIHELPVGRLCITGADGVTHSKPLLNELLSNIDEPTFNNVFAIGLDELQELRSLRDIDAAQYLFNLTAGLDRISLADVERELAVSRARILGSAEQSGQVCQLRGERDRLRAELQQLGPVNRQYSRITQHRETLNQEIARLEADAKSLHQRIRVIEIASTLREKWTERSAVETELAKLADFPPIASGGIERLDRCNTRIAARRESLEQLKREQARLKTEAAKLPLNEALARQAPRIEVLSEQHDWLASVEKEMQALNAEVQDLDAKLHSEHQRLGLPPDAARAAVAAIHPRKLAPLGPVARGIRSARQRREQARRDLRQHRETADALEKQLRAALNQRSESDLAKALERTGELVSILRRRVQVEERLTQMTRHESELQEQSRRLLDRQLLPVAALVAIGSPFVLGVVLTLIGLFLPESITGSFGWLMAALGLIGTSVAVGLKIAMERTAARQLETCRKQLEMLALQISQGREEREKLDGQIPRGGGPLVTRLQTAEGDLAALEELLPLDAQRQLVLQAANSAAARAEQATADYQAACRRWRQALSGLGLPDNWSPAQVRRFRDRSEQVGEMRRRLDRCRQDLVERQRALQGLAQRISDLARDVGLTGKHNLASQQLQQLRRAMIENQELVARRDGLLQQCSACVGAERQHRQWLARWQRRRKSLLQAAGTSDERAFRHRGELQSRVAALQERRDALLHEITAARGEWCSEEALSQLLEATTPATLDERWEELTGRLQSVERQVQQHFEQRGTLNHELKALVEDRRLERAQLELSQVDQRLREAQRRWQVLAVTSSVLAEIRRLYEAERQPETLREASVYLERLTDGKYARVWAPLGEHVLRVDDAEGRTLPVELLSRGAREQLFLSLRLSLVSMFARRGAALPVILDDILVNFDSRRARAAAVVLRDFASQGHQLLVFTCHEHILKLFRSIKVAVERLPDRSAAATITVHGPEPNSKVAPPPQPEPMPQVKPAPVGPPHRLPRPAAKRKKRAEVIVRGRKEFDPSLIGRLSRAVGLHRIDPPEDAPPEPPLARVVTAEEYEQLAAIPWDNDLDELHIEPEYPPAGSPAEFTTDVDEYESQPVETNSLTEDGSDAA